MSLFDTHDECGNVRRVWREPWWTILDLGVLLLVVMIGLLMRVIHG